MSTTQEQVSYPLPVIHMNGTGAEGLMAGYENIYDCINKLQAAMEKCIVHGRDYYPLDEHGADHYQVAWNERYKHNKAVNDFKDKIFEHMVHINAQSK